MNKFFKFLSRERYYIKWFVDEHLKEIADYHIEIPKSHEFFVPILATIPFQLISYHIAVMRDCNVDQPRNLAKSVTVE